MPSPQSAAASIEGGMQKHLLVDLLEDVLEATVIRLQNGVLGAEIQRQATAQRVLEGGVGEVDD